MRTAFYVRVSTERQQQAQTIEQQVALLRTYVVDRANWVIEEQTFSEMTVTPERSSSGQAWTRCVTRQHGRLSTSC